MCYNSYLQLLSIDIIVFLQLFEFLKSFVICFLFSQFYLEPRQKLKEELEKRGMDPSVFITTAHGEIKDV